MTVNPEGGNQQKSAQAPQFIFVTLGDRGSSGIPLKILGNGAFEPVALAAAPEDAAILFFPIALRSFLSELQKLGNNGNGEQEARRKTSSGAGGN
jgi:hypothetical protein